MRHGGESEESEESGESEESEESDEKATGARVICPGLIGSRLRRAA